MESILLIVTIVSMLFLLFPASVFIALVIFTIKEKRELNKEWERNKAEMDRRHQEFAKMAEKRMEERQRRLDERTLKRNYSKPQRGSSAKDFKYYGK